MEERHQRRLAFGPKASEQLALALRAEQSEDHSKPPVRIQMRCAGVELPQTWPRPLWHFCVGRRHDVDTELSLGPVMEVEVEEAPMARLTWRDRPDSGGGDGVCHALEGLLVRPRVIRGRLIRVIDLAVGRLEQVNSPLALTQEMVVGHHGDT
jgi:hypothetical protein